MPLSVSRLSTEPVSWFVDYQIAGVDSDPTELAVAFAFMRKRTDEPGDSDWTAGAWETVSTANGVRYAAYPVIGPNDGAIDLAQGDWFVWIRLGTTPGPKIAVIDQLTIGL